MTEITPHDGRVTLRAGGIAPLATALPEDERVSPVGAHAYTHEALAGRVVVRLAPLATSAGTDAEMSALGFAKQGERGDLGLVRYRTLGFPAWPLVHDPKKARFALEVTQDFRKAKKRAASKPGHARDAFEEIAKRLGRTVPHFLPSFWEEAGRVLADEGSASMAAQCFEKARDAERAHRLKVDPDTRDAVFLEFALLGALSAKTLSAYAKELERSEGAGDAYRRFRSLAVKRAFGGLAPWSGMGKDLRALAKSAKLDGDREDDAVVTELLGTPAIARAPREFWTTFRASLVRLGKADAGIRAQLRGLCPTPNADHEEARKKLVDEWMGLLDEIGAFADLPDDGLPEFLTKLIRWAGAAKRVQALLRDVASRISRPIAVVVKQGWWAQLDLDLAELCLSLGIPLVDPEDEFDEDEISDACDPVHVAADERYAKKLVETVASMMGNAEAERKMAGKAGFAAARRAWVEGQLGELETRGLSRFALALQELSRKTSPNTFASFEDLHARLGRVRTAPALARVLRAGIIDELGWPAFEEAADGFDAKKLWREGAFPWLVLHDQRRAVVLGADGVVLKHDFVVNAKTETVEGAIFVDQQLYVWIENKKDYGRTAYWSGAPKNRFEAKGTGYGSLGLSTTLPDGSVTLGQRAFRAGDTTIAWFGSHVFDGTTMFTHNYVGDDWVWREYDAVKGKAGRASRPTFFEEFVADGTKLGESHLTLHPVPVSTSPLGVKDGFAGFRVRRGDGPNPLVEAERIDGVKLSGRDLEVEGLLTVPAREVPLVLEAERYGAYTFTASLRAPDGEVLADLSSDAWAARGFGKKLPPLLFWHFLTPRDPIGSAALASIDDAAVERLLQAAAEDVAVGDDDAADDRSLPKAEATARSLGITSDRLVRGVAGIAARAAELARDLATLVQERSKDAAVSGGLGEDGAKLVRLDRALVAGQAKLIEDFELDLRTWLSAGRGMAMRARAPFSEDTKEAREIIRAIGQCSFVDDVTNVRILHLEDDDDDEEDDERTPWDALRVVASGASTFGVRVHEHWAIERSSDGTFRVPPKQKLEKEERLARPIGRAFVDAYLALGAEVATFDPADVDIVAGRSGLRRAEAGILLLGAPVDGYQRDYLGKERREALGLKVGEAEAARSLFTDLEEGVVDRVFEEAASEPSELAGPAWAARLGDAWKRVVGARVELPEALVLAAQKDLDAPGSVTKLLSAVAAPASSKLFAVGKWTTLGQANGWVSEPGEDGFDHELCTGLVQTLAWIVHTTPVGDPIRASVPAFHERLRAAVADPSLAWGLGTRYFEKKQEKKLHDILDLVKGKQVIPTKDETDDEPYEDGRDTGVVILGKGDGFLRGAFRPGRVARWDDPVLTGLAASLVDPDGGVDGREAIAIAKVALSKELAALAARAVDTPVPAGSFEANPLLSAKKTVTAVEKAHDLSTEAAMLYLQLLALAEPTGKAVLRWNDWKPKQYDAAVSELVKKKLVVQGKRERAQREVFLPGGFGKGADKNLPMEEWKAQFYTSPLSRRLPLEPTHALFARAWKLVEAGEGPRFEKVR